MSRSSGFVPGAIAVLIAIASHPSATQAQAQAGPFREMSFRSIGPAVTGGRVHDVQALPDDPSTVYIATASSGLWKTTNGGTTWTSLFDDQPNSTFGVVAIAPSNPDVVWAGTGEQNNRQSSSWGNGVYRSTDAGATWTHVGLTETRAIGRILVDPRDPDRAWVGALGNLWKATPERGVFRTTDGGGSWQKVLFVDTLTGVVDMAMDPTNPNTLYAATYQRIRSPCCFNGGGPGSGIWKSIDGGTTWNRLRDGLPPGDIGRIGIAISRTNPRLLYATIEHTDRGGVYRSDDAGATWTRTNPLNSRPMYYSAIYVDPTNDQRVYMLARYFYQSEDGGRTWRTMPTEPTYDVGLKGDYHALWIDPRNAEHFYLVGDGGVYRTRDMGATYEPLENLPIGQFYAINLDDESPYNVYGGMQDNHSWFGPSATRHYLGIVDGDWREIGFNDGLSQFVDLAGPRTVYSNAVDGDLTRVDATTGDRADIHPEPGPGEAPYRWEWITPGAASTHTAGMYYYGGNRLFITRDRGESWQATEDLTRRIDRDTVRIGGVRSRDVKLSRNDGQSFFSAASAVAESPVDANVLWVGTDDGNVQVSRDGGSSWTEVARNVRGIPDGTYVSAIAPSSGNAGAAVIAFDNHRRGDFAPYIASTGDYGRTWTNLSAGLPADGSARIVTEWPGSPNVLFLGTEHALYVSTDRGAKWTPFGANLPPTLYLDVDVHRRTKDVVVGTHGRSIWILDDGSALAEWTPAVAAEPAHIFSVNPAPIFHYWEDYSYRGQDFFGGENPPQGAIVDYHIAAAAPSATLTVSNAAGQLVRTLTVPGTPGIVHRAVWDLRHEPPPFEDDQNDYNLRALPRPQRPTTPAGPFVTPGTYTLTLTAGSAKATTTVEVQPDPLMPITVAQYREREAFLVELLDVQRRSYERARSAQGAAAAAARRVQSRAYALASDFNGRGAVQGTLYPPTPVQRALLEELKQALQQAGG